MEEGDAGVSVQYWDASLSYGMSTMSNVRMEQADESAGGLQVTKDQRKPRALQVEIPQENGLSSKHLFKKWVVFYDFHLYSRILAIDPRCTC